jgi:hypothetical protein
MRSLARGIVLLLFVGAATDARALVPGGRKQRADCYAEWRVTTQELAGKKRTRVDCQDGDPACDADATADGTCTFDVSVCVLQSDPAVPTCAPPAEVSFAVAPAGVEPPAVLNAPGCGPASSIRVPAGRRGRRFRHTLTMTAVAPTKPAKDADKLILRCLPGTSTNPTSCARSAHPCPPNPNGSDAPNELVATIRSSGADLDNGWLGPAINFPYAGGTRIQMCLSGCDATTNPVCETSVPFGEGTENENALGPPLPLFTAGLPVCAVVNFNPDLQPSSHGTVNLQTGEFSGTFNLKVGIYLTDEQQVCPRCNNDRCVGGPRDGAACTVDGTMFVGQASGDKNFQLSKDCPPVTTLFAGVLTLNVPITTGTSTLAPQPGGTPQVPCVAQPGEPPGFTPAADACGSGGQCVPTCGGLACVSMVPDPVTGQPVCVDDKGGLSQFCCSNKPATPCQPTRAGNPVGVVTRTGKAATGEGAWPDPTYPKFIQGGVTVATFCVPASGSNSVDGLSGLPGPGALVLPSDICVFTAP